MKKEHKIILASSSPRRKEILEKMGLKFEIIPSDYEEFLECSYFTYEKIEELAYNKAKTVIDKNRALFKTNCALILGADTVVVFNEQILGKPKNEQEAYNMLEKLSGNKHFVVTSLCAIETQSLQREFLSTTSFVEFENLSEQTINNYIKTFKPFDKAGAYGIQELPKCFVKNIEGSFENIMGLCSNSVKNILNKF